MSNSLRRPILNWMRSLVLLEPLSLHRLNCYLTRDSHLQSCASLLPPCASSAFHISSPYDAPSSFTSQLQPFSSSPSYTLSFPVRNSLFSLLISSFSALFFPIFSSSIFFYQLSPLITPISLHLTLHSLCPFVLLSIISAFSVSLPPLCSFSNPPTIFSCPLRLAKQSPTLSPSCFYQG